MNIKHTACRIAGYPRPQFVREQWMNLNGEWDFAFDYQQQGNNKFENGFIPTNTIIVPYAYQTEKSGINSPKQCNQIWYQRKLNLQFACDERVLLHLEGCDYLTEVYVNGVSCGIDIGAYHRETFDLTDKAHNGENLLVIRVEDDYSKEKSRGKQRAEDHDYGCWYIDASGIYKTAWIEIVKNKHIDNVIVTPNVSKHGVDFNFSVSGENVVVETTISYQGEIVNASKTAIENGTASQFLSVEGKEHYWEVLNPELYDLTFTLKDSLTDEVFDRVGSYFGLREIKIVGNQILLNDKPLYQKLVLDQGYFKGSDLTAPNESAFENDIVEMISMGFNGARKHEKVEDERFLYLADVYGYIVWAEMPSMYSFTEKSCENFKREWQLVVKQQYNHPCVLCYVPFNESWGVESIKTDKAQQDFVNGIYYDTKRIDTMRPVITNDGWHHTISDIITIHHYTQSGNTMLDAFNTVEKCTDVQCYLEHDHGPFADGFSYQGQPIMITEFGGTSFVKDISGNRWGYGEGAKDEKDFLARFESLFMAINSIDFIRGYCYTQLSDVYHEVNGLLTFDRREKILADKIKNILDRTGNKSN